MIRIGNNNLQRCKSEEVSDVSNEDYRGLGD
jgi:hypothetical protein